MNSIQKKIIYILLYGALVVYGNEARAQKKIGMSFGAGYPDCVNLGVNYSFSDKIQTELKLGSIYTSFPEMTITSAVNLRYFYTGKSKHTDRPAWFITNGLTYIFIESESTVSHLLFANLRHGRMFEFSEKFGLTLEAGIAFAGYLDLYRKGSYETIDEDYQTITPSFSIDMFYRF